MPRVSILLTCYNHLQFLPAAVQAVRDQTFGDFEILALDDVSTDGTRDWLDGLQTGEPRVRLIFNPKNLGTYATLNLGLELAKGEFIAILNDDDLWAPEKLAKQVALLDSNPEIAMVHTGGWFIDDQGNRHSDPAPLGFTYPSLPTGDVLPKLIDHNQIITSSVLVRRSAFEKAGEFDTNLFGSGDWQMWLRIARNSPIGYVPDPLTFYRVHGSNASHSTDKIYKDDARIREWITSWEPDYKEKPAALAQAFAHNWACLGTVYAWEGRPADARTAYGKSIKRLPTRLKSYLRWLLTFLPRKTFRKLE